MIEIFTSYIISAILIASVFAISLLLGLTLAGRSRRARLLFGLAGIVLIAVAALEKLGWTVRPWTHGSPAEALNDLTFRLVFLTGLGLLFLSWTMSFLREGLRGSSRPRGVALAMQEHVAELELGLPPASPEHVLGAPGRAGITLLRRQAT